MLSEHKVPQLSLHGVPLEPHIGSSVLHAPYGANAIDPSWYGTRTIMTEANYTKPSDVGLAWVVDYSHDNRFDDPARYAPQRELLQKAVDGEWMGIIVLLIHPKWTGTGQIREGPANAYLQTFPHGITIGTNAIGTATGFKTARTQPHPLTTDIPEVKWVSGFAVDGGRPLATWGGHVIAAAQRVKYTMWVVQNLSMSSAAYPFSLGGQHLGTLQYIQNLYLD